MGNLGKGAGKGSWSMCSERRRSDVGVEAAASPCGADRPKRQQWSGRRLRRKRKRADGEEEGKNTFVYKKEGAWFDVIRRRKQNAALM